MVSRELRAPRDLRVLSVYEGFFSGGARALHTTVVGGLHTGGRQRHTVLSIHEEMHRESMRQRMVDDPRYRALRAVGVPVATLGRRQGVGTAPQAHAFGPGELAVAARHVARADLVLSLKEQPLRLLDQPGLPSRPVVACLHRSDPENQGEALDHLLGTVRSGLLAAAICCAESTRDAYAAAGVPRSLLRVVPNGVDLARFFPATAPERAALRARHHVPVDVDVVAFAARYDGMKDVALFVRTARAYLAEHPTAHVLACGAGMSLENPGLAADVEAAFADRVDLLDRLHLLGVQHDMRSVYAAADVVALTSAWGEAAPLCLIEGAMCGAVPVATDVGDCRVIVDGIGILAARDPFEIAAAWGEAARRRGELTPVLEEARPRFSHTRMIATYAGVLDDVHRAAGGSRTPRAAWRSA